MLGTRCSTRCQAAQALGGRRSPASGPTYVLDISPGGRRRRPVRAARQRGPRPAGDGGTSAPPPPLFAAPNSCGAGLPGGVDADWARAECRAGWNGSAWTSRGPHRRRSTSRPTSRGRRRTESYGAGAPLSGDAVGPPDGGALPVRRASDALAAYQQARTVLAAELGIEPDPSSVSWRPRYCARICVEWPLVDGSPPSRSLAGQATSRPAHQLRRTRNPLTDARRAVGEHRLVTLRARPDPGRRGWRSRRSVLGDDFADGVWLVELGPVADPARYRRPSPPHSPAVQPACCRPARDRPASAGRDSRIPTPRHLLLVLDNCEHLLPGLTEWARGGLVRRAGPTVLATSREPLGIVGEIQQWVSLACWRPSGPRVSSAAKPTRTR